MVAYGAPNRWHKKSHRGRKRCGCNSLPSRCGARSDSPPPPPTTPTCAPAA
jgi:hypothetical protein